MALSNVLPVRHVLVLRDKRIFMRAVDKAEFNRLGKRGGYFFGSHHF